MRETCAWCGRGGNRHGTFFAAGYWGYSCDPEMFGRDWSNLPKVWDIEDLPADLQKRMDDAEAAYLARKAKEEV